MLIPGDKMNWKQKLSKNPHIGKIVHVGGFSYEIIKIHPSGKLDIKSRVGTIHGRIQPTVFEEFK